MAERPVFLPSADGPLVTVRLIAFHWHSGFAPVQKRKNVSALHDSARSTGLTPLLEVSTKSDEPLGQRLSAFNLKVHTSDGKDIPLECAFQGSKVFEGGGPYTDLFDVDARAAQNRTCGCGRRGHSSDSDLGIPHFPWNPRPLSTTGCTSPPCGRIASS